MTGVRRRQGRFSAHLLYALSVFALLAFASFPVAAAADSSNIQYSDAPPTATGKESVKETPAKTSKANGGSTNPSNTPGSKEAHSPEEESPGSTQSKSDAVPVAPSQGGGNGGSGPQSTQHTGSHGSKGGNGAQAGGQTAKPVAASKDKGSDSSPLVPILIAIAVLAAISIGAVMLRQRRQRGGGSTPSVSPKAG